MNDLTYFDNSPEPWWNGEPQARQDATGEILGEYDDVAPESVPYTTDEAAFLIKLRAGVRRNLTPVVV